jgi:hypothetical protein
MAADAGNEAELHGPRLAGPCRAQRRSRFAWPATLITMYTAFTFTLLSRTIAAIVTAWWRDFTKQSSMRAAPGF